MSAQYTKTLDNTSENILLLESQGYKKSNVSKPFNVNSKLRYNPVRMVYWFSSSQAAYESDCFFTRQSIGTIFVF